MLYNCFVTKISSSSPEAQFLKLFFKKQLAKIIALKNRIH